MSHHHPHTLVALGLNILTLSHSLQKTKNKARLWPKLRWPLLLTVECLYGAVNLCKLEVYNMFAILVRGVVEDLWDLSRNS